MFFFYICNISAYLNFTVTHKNKIWHKFETDYCDSFQNDCWYIFSLFDIPLGCNCLFFLIFIINYLHSNCWFLIYKGKIACFHVHLPKKKKIKATSLWWQVSVIHSWKTVSHFHIKKKKISFIYFFFSK